MNNSNAKEKYDRKYCYPNSFVLINAANINDKNDLELFERNMSAKRIAETRISPIKGNFDFKHLQAIHKHIFQDVYPKWAGKPRSVDISKDQTRFCYAENISNYANEVFIKIANDKTMITDNSQTVFSKLAMHIGDINALHAFREGNGRTQRLFIEYQAKIAGISIDYSKTSPEEMLYASKQSLLNNNKPFEEIMAKISSPLTNEQQRKYIATISPKVLAEFDILARTDGLPNRFIEFEMQTNTATSANTPSVSFAYKTKTNAPESDVNNSAFSTATSQNKNQNNCVPNNNLPKIINESANRYTTSPTTLDVNGFSKTPAGKDDTNMSMG
jgi:cell filamentation protein